MAFFSSLLKLVGSSTAVTLIVYLLLCSLLPAQESDKPAEPRSSDLPALPEVLKEGTLKLDARLYLPDNKGEPRFVPNMLLSDLLDLASANASRKDGAALQTYTMDDLRVDVHVEADLANIVAQATVTLHSNALAVTDIPLRLQSCQLTEAINFTGNGKSHGQVGRSEPGYNWCLQAEPNSTHVAKLVGQSALSIEGDRQSLQLTLPSARTTIEIVLPLSHQDVRVRGQGGEIVRVEPLSNEQKVVVRCSGGDMNVSWRRTDVNKPRSGAVEAISNTRWRIDDPRQPWEAESEIKLRAFGDSNLDTLTVDLPPDSVWLPSTSSAAEAFTVTSTQNSPSSKVQLTIRSVARTGLTSLDAIPLRWRCSPTQKGDDSKVTKIATAKIAVPNLNISGVDRHEGTTTLNFSSSYGLDWKTQLGTELVQQSRSSDVQEQSQYVFRFVRQPQDLLVSFRRELNLVEVSPTFLVEIDRGKVKLTGWLQCSFERNQKPELALNFGDWTFDSAQEINDMSSAYAKGELLSSQPMPDGLTHLSNKSDMELVGASRRYRQLWRIVAYRQWNKNSIEQIRMTVPGIFHPNFDDNKRVPVEQAAGALLIAATDSVLINWDELNSRSLLADALSNEWSALLPQPLLERALAYRFQAGAETTPLWSGRVEVLPRRIALEHSASVRLDLTTARIVQSYQLQIANEAVEKLILTGGSTKDLSVLVNGVPCVLQELVEPEREIGSERARMVVVGAPRLIGKVLVEIRSEFPLELEAMEDETVVELPFVKLDLPAASGSLTQLSISADRRLQCMLSQSPQEPRAWLPLPSLPIEIPMVKSGLEVSIRHRVEMDSMPVRVSGAWLQTTLNGNTRLDRFCARFVTEQDTVSLSLPRIDHLNVQVAIDGVSQPENGVLSDGRMQLNLKQLGNSQEHTVEVWIWSATNLGWFNQIDVVPVRIDGCRRIDRFYWQLVTPSNQHLVYAPDSVTPEWRWVWDRLWWKRYSPQDQAYFEQWLGTTTMQQHAVSANRYVVSSFGTIPGFRVTTIARLFLWLPVGLVAIVCALAVSVWRALRHPVSVIVLSAAILFTAAVWPDLAVLVGQTSLLGLAVILLYGLTQAAVESRVRRRSVFTTRPTSVSNEASDHPTFRPGSHASGEIAATTRSQSPAIAEGGGH